MYGEKARGQLHEVGNCGPYLCRKYISSSLFSVRYNFRTVEYAEYDIKLI